MRTDEEQFSAITMELWNELCSNIRFLRVPYNLLVCKCSILQVITEHSASGICRATDLLRNSGIGSNIELRPFSDPLRKIVMSGFCDLCGESWEFREVWI